MSDTAIAGAGNHTDYALISARVGSGTGGRVSAVGMFDLSAVWQPGSDSPSTVCLWRFDPCGPQLPVRVAFQPIPCTSRISDYLTPIETTPNQL